MKDDIIVLHGRHVKKALPKVANKRFAWLYLGQDIKQRENISQVLGKENRYFIGSLLQDTAHEQKQPFLDFIAELGLHQKNKLYWWASNVAYKNPLASDFFLLWCYASIFDKVCVEGEWDRQNLLVVFVQDRWLYRYLWQRYKGHARSLRFFSRKGVLPEVLNCVARGIAVRVHFVLKAGYEMWKSRSVPSRGKITDSVGNERRIYLYSWIRDRSFKKNGDFQDPYLGRLQEIVGGAGISATYITPPFLTLELKKKCLDYGKCEFVFLDGYISLRRLLRSSFSLLRICFPEDFDHRFPSLRTLLQREMAYEFSSFPSNILYYSVFEECLEAIRQEEVIIIYPFENQPWEKMLCLAAKDSGKNIKLIGYQHSTVPLTLLNYFLGAGESTNMPLPHLIVTNGEYTLDLLKDAGYGETEFVNGGALRYEYMRRVEKGLNRKNELPGTVLVAMAYSRNVTEEILVSLFNSFKDLTEEGIRFLIKFHPEVPLERLRLQLPAWPAHFEKTDRPLEELWQEVDLAICSSSTVGLEALLNGVPVVRCGSEYMIDLDPLDALGENILRTCHADNLEQVVLSTLKERDDYLAQQSTLSCLDKFFAPVDEDVWRQLLDN